MANRLWIYRVLGVVVVGASTALTAVFAPQYPGVIGSAITAVNAVVSVAVGKWLGIPIADIVQLALARMTPDRAVEVAVAALKSLPPEQAESATRALLDSIPPDAAARVRSLPSPPPPIGRSE